MAGRPTRQGCSHLYVPLSFLFLCVRVLILRTLSSKGAQCVLISSICSLSRARCCCRWTTSLMGCVQQAAARPPLDGAHAAAWHTQSAAAAAQSVLSVERSGLRTGGEQACGHRRVRRRRRRVRRRAGGLSDWPDLRQVSLRLSLRFHCLSLRFHCLSLPFAAFPLPCDAAPSPPPRHDVPNDTFKGCSP